MSGQSEEKIENEADAGHAEQVADGVFKSELFAHIVDGGQSRNEHEPNACEESGKDERLSERVERRVIVEFHPRFRDELP